MRGFLPSLRHRPHTEFLTGPRVDAATALTGHAPATVTADQGYAYSKVYGALERRGIEFSNGTGTGVRLDHAKAEEFARQSGQTQKEADRADHLRELYFFLRAVAALRLVH